MNKKIASRLIFFSILALVVFMCGCRPDTEITSSASSKNGGDESVLSSASSKRTIQLPLSKKTVTVGEKMTPEKIADRDQCLASPNNQSK